MNTPMKNSVYTFSQNLQIAQGKKTLSYLGIYITGKKSNGMYFVSKTVLELVWDNIVLID